MWREELILNKIFAIIMILIGALLVPVEWDATFFLFTLIVGGYLFFAKRNWIVLLGNGYGKSRTKKRTEVRTKIQNSYIQSHKRAIRCNGS